MIIAHNIYAIIQRFMRQGPDDEFDPVTLEPDVTHTAIETVPEEEKFWFDWLQMPYHQQSRLLHVVMQHAFKIPAPEPGVIKVAFNKMHPNDQRSNGIVLLERAAREHTEVCIGMHSLNPVVKFGRLERKIRDLYQSEVIVHYFFATPWYREFYFYPQRYVAVKEAERTEETVFMETLVDNWRYFISAGDQDHRFLSRDFQKFCQNVHGAVILDPNLTQDLSGDSSAEFIPAPEDVEKFNALLRGDDPDEKNSESPPSSVSIGATTCRRRSEIVTREAAIVSTSSEVISATPATLKNQFSELLKKGSERSSEIVFGKIDTSGFSLEISEEDRLGGLAIAKKAILYCLEKDTSDLHIMTGRDADLTTIALRIAGNLLDSGVIPDEDGRKMVAALQTQCGLETSESLPQDGSFRFEWQGKPISARVATGRHGPKNEDRKMVIRFLRPDTILPFNELFQSETMFHLIEQVVQEMQGLLIICGETGSGKSTTMASLIAHLLEKFEYSGIITVENPIEYNLRKLSPARVTQHQVNERKNITAAVLMRMILRMDPDVVLVGEARDAEEFSLAAELANSGHLVLTTFHANAAMETLYRIASMFRHNRLVMSEIKAVVAQDLVPDYDGGRMGVFSFLRVIDELQEIFLMRETFSKFEMYNVVRNNPGCFISQTEYAKELIAHDLVPTESERMRAILARERRVGKILSHKRDDKDGPTLLLPGLDF